MSAFALHQEQLFDLLSEECALVRDAFVEPSLSTRNRGSNFRLFSSHFVSEPHGEDAGQEIPMLSQIYGGRQELLSSEEELQNLIRRVHLNIEMLGKKDLIKEVNTHFIYQFSVTSINKWYPGGRGSPSFGMRDEVHSTQVSISSTHKTSADSFSPYSPYQVKQTSISGEGGVSISQSTLTVLESAGCEGMVHRDIRASQTDFKSLDALWNVVSQNVLKGEAKINPLLSAIDRRGHIHCGVVVCAAPTLSEVECAFHSVKFGHRALSLYFKPEKNIMQSESSIARLLESYERAISSRSKNKYNSYSRNFHTTSHSPAPPSPRGQNPLFKEIKTLQHKLSLANKKIFLQQSQLLKFQLPAYQSQKSLFQIPTFLRRQIVQEDELLIKNAGLIHPGTKMQRRFILQKVKSKPEGRDQDLAGVREEMLQRALKEREIEVFTQNQKILFLFEALQRSETRERTVNSKLAKEKQRFEGKEFLMEKVKESLNFHKERADIMRCKLQFFQSLNPALLARINDDQIEALENHYSYLQERLKEEKARRIYKHKIDALKQQIKMLRRNDESPQSELERSSFLKQHLLDPSGNVNAFFESEKQGSVLDSSQASEPYLQLLGDQRSFEDSLLTQDDQSHFQKFAADNQYFQKIFSELFLGGEKAKKTIEEGTKKLEESSQKILDDISCLAQDAEGGEMGAAKEELKEEQEAVGEEIQYPTTYEGCEAFFKRKRFEPSLRIKEMIERQAQDLQRRKREHESEVQSNRPVAAEEVIALPSDMICSPRLLPMKGYQDGRNATDFKALNRSAGDAWERAIELEIKKLDFDKRIRQKFSEEGGTRLRETRLAFTRPEKASLSPALNCSYQHTHSSQKLLRPELKAGFHRPQDTSKLPTKALKIYPSARLDRISPKCGTPVHISSTLGTGGKNTHRSDPYENFQRESVGRESQLSKKQSGKLPSPAGEMAALENKKGRMPQQAKMLKNLILSENFEKQHKYPLTPTAQTSKRSSFKVFGVQKKR